MQAKLIPKPNWMKESTERNNLKRSKSLNLQKNTETFLIQRETLSNEFPLLNMKELKRLKTSYFSLRKKTSKFTLSHLV